MLYGVYPELSHFIEKYIKNINLYTAVLLRTFYSETYLARGKERLFENHFIHIRLGTHRVVSGHIINCTFAETFRY